MTLIERAKKKFDKRKNSDITYQGKSFNDFLLECYLDIDPSSYGKFIQNMLEHLCDKKDIKIFRIKDKEDCGDLRAQYPSYETFHHKHENDLYYELYLPDHLSRSKMDWEFKVSYLGKKDGYTIRNIRPYQKINGGYIICLVDCENDFKEEFYVIDFDVLEEYFNLSHMNGTKDQHKTGTFNNLGTAFKKGSRQHNLLKWKSKLKGTSLDDLFSYFKEVKSSLREQFIVTEEYRKHIEFESNRIIGERGIICLEEDIEPAELDKIFDKLKLKYNRIMEFKVTFHSWSKSQFSLVIKLSGIDSYDYCSNALSEFQKMIKVIGLRLHS